MIHFIIVEILISLFLPGPAASHAGHGKKVLQTSMCVDCHGALVEHEVMHMPASDACDNCHESTGESHPREGVMGFTLMDQIPELCFYCHEEPADPSHGHQPVAEGACLSCHDAHGSSEPSLLHLPGEELCLSCHNRVYRTDSSETINIRRLVRGQAMAHSAIDGGGCTVCHQAHGSEYRALLNTPYPEADYLPAKTENFELCFLCHDTDIIDAEETQWATNFRNGNRNLHFVHINGNKGRNCRMCHNLHGSPQPYLVEEVVEFGKWEMEMNFIPRENGGSCLPGCHGNLSYTR